MLLSFYNEVDESLGLDSIAGLEFNSERTQFNGPIGDASHGITVVKNVPKGILRDYHDGEVLEVMAQFARCQQHGVVEFLDLRVPRLGIRKYFANEVDRALYLLKMFVFLSLNDDSSADDIGSHCDVQQQIFFLDQRSLDGR